MRHSILLLVAATVLAAVLPAAADPGDPGGWFVNVDRRGRAFLTFTPRPDGPRLLMLACLNDAEMFTAMSAAVGERDEHRNARLSLANGQASFVVDGEVTFYPHTGRSAFIADVDADRAALKEFGRRLLPVLQGAGDLTLTISRGDGAGAPATATIPTIGLAAVLPRFRQVCF